MTARPLVSVSDVAKPPPAFQSLDLSLDRGEWARDHVPFPETQEFLGRRARPIRGGFNKVRMPETEGN